MTATKGRIPKIEINAASNPARERGTSGYWAFKARRFRRCATVAISRNPVR
jgi:hypothetical protein